jgi:hypothetical protein
MSHAIRSTAMLALLLTLSACEQDPSPAEVEAPASSVQTEVSPVEPQGTGPAAVNTERLLAADSEPGSWMSYGRS